jgi:WD40 repeat protein
VVFAPDGDILATADVSSVHLWNARSGERIGQPRSEDRVPRRIAFTPDGKVMLTRDLFGVVRMWEVRSGRPLGPPIHAQQTVNSAALSADGRRVATLDIGGSIRLWDVPKMPERDDDMQYMTWKTLGLRLSPTGSVEAIGPGEWNALTPTASPVR